MKKEQLTWPDGLNELFEHVSSIPANDEFELRVAVHDLQSFVTQKTGEYQHIDSAILAVCCNIVQQAAQNLTLTTSEKNIDRYHSKPYIRSINALICTLLSKMDVPQSKLCLDGLRLQKSNLDHIDLNHSSLRMTNLSHCRLSRANLHHVDFRFSNMMSAILTHANLSESMMEFCEMDWCDLSHADLHGCQLMKADLGGSILDHTDLSYAILSGSNLASTTLSHANLSHANLFAARLHFVKLHGCDLTATGITPERLENANMDFHADQATIWGTEDDCCGRNPLDPSYYAEQQRLL